jgi:hypothetical protein
MFSYSPQTQDRSGEIIGAGMMSAADAQANAMAGFGQNIGNALQTIGGMYGEVEARKAKGRAFKDVFKVVSSSAGIDMKQLEQLTGGSLKSDMDWANASETISPILPSLINARLVQGNMGIKQQGQQIQQNAPIRRAQVNAAAQAAAGQQRMTTLPSGINPDVIP